MYQATGLSLSQALHTFITDSANGKRKMPSGKKISAGAIQNYRYTLQKLEAWEQQTGETIRIRPLVKMTASIMKREQRYWKKFFRGFSAFLYQQNACYDNYVAAHFKTLKSVFNYLKIEKAVPVGDFHRQFITPLQQPLPVVLMPEQLQYLIADIAFRNSLPVHLQRTCDIFVFGCTTGLRISDLMALKHKHMVVQGSHCWLQVYTQKTGSAVLIPLPSYCIDIIQKYGRHKNSYLLPRLSNTNLNINLKSLGRLAQWDHTLPKYRSRKGKWVEIKNSNGSSWKFYQHLTAHTMRRTAITSLLMMGVDEAVVRRISGHAPGSREFYRYVALAQSYTDSQVIRAQERLLQDPEWYRKKS